MIASAEGSPGRALAFAALDLAPLEEQALAILREGDPTNARRSKLAQALALKAAAERYAAFLELVPSLIAREARGLNGPRARPRARRLRPRQEDQRARPTALARPGGDHVPARLDSGLRRFLEALGGSG